MQIKYNEFKKIIKNKNYKIQFKFSFLYKWLYLQLKYTIISPVQKVTSLESCKTV